MIHSIGESVALRRLGQTVRQARLRRNLSQGELAERMGVSRHLVVKLEKGAPGVGIGYLVKAMSIFGYPERLEELLGSDPIGDEYGTGRKRARAHGDVANF